MHSLSSSSRASRTLPAVAAAVAIATALTALAGWLWDVAALRSVLPGHVAMNPMTALAFLLSGLALFLLGRGAENQRLTQVGHALAAAVALIGLAKLSDLAGVTRFQFDQSLFQDRLQGAAGLPPNRMAPNTALNFVLLGVALLTLNLEWRRHRPSQLVALSVVGLSLLAVLGYAFDVHQLYGLTAYIPMALNTALAFLVLSVAVLFAHPERGITTVFVANDAGGMLARRVTPLALLVPSLLAWARLQAHRSGTFEGEPGVSVMVFTSSVLITGVIWFTAIRLSRAESERLEAVRRLQGAHDELESRVAERTNELATANDELRHEADEHVRTEQALRDSEQRYRMLFLSNPHPMWVYDRRTLGFLAVNQAAIELYGYTVEEFLRMSLRDIHPKEGGNAPLDDLARPRSDLNPAKESRHVCKNGRLLDVEVSSHTLEFAGREAALVLAHDVTGRKQLEAQFRQSQKMEAIGRLAAGVAHDFNNLLTTILGHSHLLATRPAGESPTGDDIAEIEKAAFRAAALTRQLLAFSRQQVLQPRVLDLNSVIVDMDKMLRRMIGEDIDLQTTPARELGQIKADPGQIEQVIMNLVVNARDAMPDGGKLTIETSNVTLTRGHAQGRDGLAVGPCVRLAVTDSGVGMDSETEARIFEPFFTTKEVGRGTGLGLSTTHGIVKQSGGHIEVYSEPGQGTTFKIFFPRVEVAHVADASRAAGRPVRGSETILVIEDDELVRKTVVKALRVHGYTVLEAADRGEALARCEAAERGSEPIDLVVSDVVMPGIGIGEMITRLRATHPRTPILYMSGYTDKAMAHQGVLAMDAAFLQKPFSVDALLGKVRELLNEPRASAA